MDTRGMDEKEGYGGEGVGTAGKKGNAEGEERRYEVRYRRDEKFYTLVEINDAMRLARKTIEEKLTGAKVLDWDAYEVGEVEV